MSLTVSVTATSFVKNERLIAECRSRFPEVEWRFCAPDENWTEEALISFLGSSDVWLVGKEPVSSKVLDHCSNIKLVTKYGVGLDNIDFSACKSRSVEVYFEKGVNSQEVAELTLAFMISLCRNIGMVSTLYTGAGGLKTAAATSVVARWEL